MNNRPCIYVVVCVWGGGGIFKGMDVVVCGGRGVGMALL